MTGCANERHSTAADKTLIALASGDLRLAQELESVAFGFSALGQVELEGDAVYWIEFESRRNWRAAIMRSDDAGVVGVVGDPYNVASRVYEYGGRAYVVVGGVIYFSNSNWRLYKLDRAGAMPITPPARLRYADGTSDPRRDRTIWVCEDARPEGLPKHALVAVISAVTGEPTPPRRIVEGAEFYAAPRVSPDGSALAWLQWNGPAMSWQAAELWVAHLNARGETVAARRIAGDRTGSAAAPLWLDDGRLSFVLDSPLGWELHVFDGSATRRIHDLPGECVPVFPLAGASYGMAANGDVVAVVTRGGRQSLMIVRADGSSVTVGRWSSVEHLRVQGERAAFVGSSSTEPPALVTLDVPAAKITIRRRGPCAGAFVPSSAPERIDFDTADGSVAYAWYYAAEGSRTHIRTAPLLVNAHGGPTASAERGFSPVITFWLRQGFAFLDVDYRGSIGYGSRYRDAISGRWGVVDVDDCIDATHAIISRSEVDPGRVALRGVSAGGYTVLRALLRPGHPFCCGVCIAGISDLCALREQTHKYERGYLEALVGSWPAAKPEFRSRSPLFVAERLTSPLLVLHGTHDPVVPIRQADELVARIRGAGGPVEYVRLDGHGHGAPAGGYILAEMLAAERDFYSRVLGLPSHGQDVVPGGATPRPRHEGQGEVVL
jgi:dipeptidyl aminopeptidase/acylaminoacyl peptidase